ncbi:hypothetical protein Ldro_3094 [Legionella drozanskii LLAP-1]|uniref:Uncharacterized protein n=1 Tax=Legionella drozanskii LLAP-1 TaxID=1212489 RepID=A0A0W0SKU5_9GAMM|nr:hypothetical protein Ldro_3094 [Legionella drozanskii LLAP-1]
MLTEKHYYNLLNEKPKFRSINSAKFDIVKRVEVFLYQLTNSWPNTYVENNYFTIYIRKARCREENLLTLDIARLKYLKNLFREEGMVPN